jgi:hypothetical protein
VNTTKKQLKIEYNKKAPKNLEKSKKRKIKSKKRKVTST